MQLTPVYGSDPVLVLDVDHRAALEATLRQRRRFADELAALDDAAWTSASRCEGWTVRDVVVHLDTTNAFWRYSISAGLAGSPTQLLAEFDPVASPAAMVAASPAGPAEVLASFQASTAALCDLLEGLDDQALRATAEAPPGHLAVGAVVHHALWDSLVHEHDVLGPLGLEVPRLDDEVTGALAYAAGLGAGYDLTRGVHRQGTLAVVATDPDVVVVVEVGGHVGVRLAAMAPEGADVVLHGDAGDLLDVLSVRRPLAEAVPEDTAWLVTGLATAFDQ